jgi:ketosteroid isomerase-like protein
MRHTLRHTPLRSGVLLAVGSVIAISAASASPADDAKTVGALDKAYQAAVKANDADAMARILADDFVLVTGRGETHDKNELLKAAREKTVVYEKQDELEQHVRVWGETAVATALLWIKGTSAGSSFERKLWFSDTYVRTKTGWKYVLGQASLPLPDEPGRGR